MLVIGCVDGRGLRARRQAVDRARRRQFGRRSANHLGVEFLADGKRDLRGV